MGAARAADLHLDADRAEPRQRRVEPVPAAGLRVGAVGRGLRRRDLAGAAGDRPAHRGGRGRRPAEERLGGGLDAARSGRACSRGPIGPSCCRRARAFGRFAGARAASPRRAQRPAAEHAGAATARVAAAKTARRRSRERRRRRPRRPQRRHAATQARARAGAAAARRAAAPPAFGNLAHRPQRCRAGDASSSIAPR